MSEQAVSGPVGVVGRPAVREVDLLAQEIMTARENYLKARIGKAEKRDRVWFGDIHDCDRHNFYSMAEGDQRTRWDAYVQAKLDAGREWEQITKRELSILGYEPMLAGETVEIKDKRGKVIARGRTDLSLRRIASDDHRATLYPVEMKQMQPHSWAAITKWEDMLRSPWTRKYVRQLMLYMFGKNIEQGLFLLGDFQGHWKPIPVYLDYEFVEDAISKIERATQASEDGSVPERIPYNSTLCGSCQFAHVCIPDIKSIGIKEIANETTAAMLERREALAEKAKEYAKIDKYLRDLFKDLADGVFRVGNFIITRKGISKRKVELPDDVKEKYTVMKTEYRNEIERFQQPDPEKIFLEPKRAFDFGDGGE